MRAFSIALWRCHSAIGSGPSTREVLKIASHSSLTDSCSDRSGNTALAHAGVANETGRDVVRVVLEGEDGAAGTEIVQQLARQLESPAIPDEKHARPAELQRADLVAREQAL